MDQIWSNFRQNLTKFHKICLNLTKFLTEFNFFCIIKQFHPPSWRLSGPETGFWQKISKFWPNFTFFCLNLTTFRQNWQNLIKIWQNFDWIWQNFDQIWQNLPKFRLNFTIFFNFDRIWQNLIKFSTEFDKISQNFSRWRFLTFLASKFLARGV